MAPACARRLGAAGCAADLLRVLAGWFEIANVDERLAELAGRPAAPAYRLGALATAWPRLAQAGSPQEVRGSLASSPWADPGGDDPRTLRLGMRLSLAARVAARVPHVDRWAAGGAAVVAARELLLADRRLSAGPARLAAPLLGVRWMDAAGVADLRGRLPSAARWALDAVDDPADLWRAEARWWSVVESDGLRLLRDPEWGPAPVVGAVAALAADAWRVTAALEAAVRGAPEVFDAVA